MDIASILKTIIKKNSTLSPVILVDEYGLYEEYISGFNNVISLDSPSKITLTKTLADKNLQCIYMKTPVELSGVIASGRANKLDITPVMILNEVESLKGKIRGTIQLSAGQKILLLKNFNNICNSLSSKDSIDDVCVKREILLHIQGMRVSARGLLLQILNGEITREKLITLELLSFASDIIENELSISMTPYGSYEHLLSKVMVTYSKNKYKEYGGACMNDYLVDASDMDISTMARFILDNVGELRNPIDELDELYKDVEPITLTYAIPRLFIKFLGNHMDSFIQVDEEKLWTEEMKNVGAYVSELRILENAIFNNINYKCVQNNIEFLFDEYKNNFSRMDSAYRRVEAYYEKLAFLPDFYMNDSLHSTMNNVKQRYHNVISKLNGRLFEYYNQYINDRKVVLKQSEFIESRKFKKRTLFILADGFRYEMAHELIERFSGYDIEDVDVIGELPSETEIGMNSYFIIDEKVELSDRNVFSLKKDGKIEFHICDWRKENLSKKLGCNVITFEEFKKNKNYGDSVICFFDEADVNMHHFNSASKMSEAIDNLEKILRYALGREYDVVLLSDHGFVDIEKKIDVQDKTITSEKKKNRYLILNKNEDAKEMYYDDSISSADYLEMGNKKLCFINSTNSLRETGKYNHGGISFQENVITCFVIHGAKQEMTDEQKVFFETIKAYNEITGKIRGARGYVCNVMSGTDLVFNVMIDVDEYLLHVPVRQYEQGTEFLIMVSNGENTQKTIVKKEGGRVIDKDLDIFS
ncbi:PglZ domain-containing protein [Bariatricus sp. HCP28S3_A7]|uniref:PglZ domain-containing protein n=1 Tax=Bariatricus sp. HCP28S3_A7 TaxID=3438894 RepID=UPI003F8A1B50